MTRMRSGVRLPLRPPVLSREFVLDGGFPRSFGGPACALRARSSGDDARQAGPPSGRRPWTPAAPCGGSGGRACAGRLLVGRPLLRCSLRRPEGGRRHCGAGGTGSWRRGYQPAYRSWQTCGARRRDRGVSLRRTRKQARRLAKAVRRRGVLRFGAGGERAMCLRPRAVATAS